jgi:hypothetical protein
MCDLVKTITHRRFSLLNFSISFVRSSNSKAGRVPQLPPPERWSIGLNSKEVIEIRSLECELPTAKRGGIDAKYGHEAPRLYLRKGKSENGKRSEIKLSRSVRRLKNRAAALLNLSMRKGSMVRQEHSRNIHSQSGRHRPVRFIAVGHEVAVLRV